MTAFIFFLPTVVLVKAVIHDNSIIEFGDTSKSELRVWICGTGLHHKASVARRQFHDATEESAAEWKQMTSD